MTAPIAEPAGAMVTVMHAVGTTAETLGWVRADFQELVANQISCRGRKSRLKRQLSQPFSAGRVDRICRARPRSLNFGWPVAVSGDYAIVGAPRVNSGGANEASGAYMFERSGSNWLPRSESIVGLAHVTNRMARAESDFEKEVRRSDARGSPR